MEIDEECAPPVLTVSIHVGLAGKVMELPVEVAPAANQDRLPGEIVYAARRGLFPVVRDFLCIIPTEQVLYYRNLGLYYGLASGTLPLYSGPCLGVRGGCVACEMRFPPPQGPRHIKNATVILVHYSGGKKYDGSKTIRQGL